MASSPPAASPSTTFASDGRGSAGALTLALAAIVVGGAPRAVAGQDPSAPPVREVAPRSIELVRGQAVRLAVDVTQADGEPVEMILESMPSMMRGPQPGRVEALRRPEFIRRDLPIFVDGLGFDDAQSMIAETLLDEYGEAFTLAAAPLEDALDRYRRQRSDRSLARILDEANREDVVGGSGTAAAVVVGGTDGSAVFVLRQSGGGAGGAGGSGTGSGAGADGDESPRPVARSITILSDAAGQARAEDAADGVASLLDRVRARLEAAERAGEIVTAPELVRLARRLRAERELLRTEFLELIGLIAEGREPGESDARLAAVTGRVLIERELPQGRLGGESLDLHAALASAGDEAGSPEARAAARQHLDAARTSLAAVLQGRAEATLDREITGLEVLVARERREQAMRTAMERGTPMPTAEEPEPEVRRFVAASRRELDARVAVRDDRLARMDAIEAGLADASPAGARAFRHAAKERAFPSETRPRWSERALRHAESLEGLDATVAAAITGIRAEHDLAAGEVRDRRIAERIIDEPAAVRDHIDAMLETDSGRSVPLDPSTVRAASDPTAQQRLDRRVRERLAAVLTPEQVASLPSERRVIRMGGFSIGSGEPKDE